MNVGDVIVAKVIAIGADSHSFMFPVKEKSTKPIIVDERLKMNNIYKIEITRDATNFYMARVVDRVSNYEDEQSQ